MKIEALHEFHDKQFAEDWANRFIPTKERVSLFELILRNIEKGLGESLQILELGIGPGYLAEYILRQEKHVIYEGLDFSEPMLGIAAKRLEAFANQKIFTKVDLTSTNWSDKIKSKPQNIVSTWALHDLLSSENIFEVYKMAFEILPKGGKLINGDFIKPEKSKFVYEAGRIKPSEHLEFLKLAGFQNYVCLKIFESNIENPTTSNNYACFVAVK